MDINRDLIKQKIIQIFESQPSSVKTVFRFYLPNEVINGHKSLDTLSKDLVTSLTTDFDLKLYLYTYLLRTKDDISKNQFYIKIVTSASFNDVKKKKQISSYWFELLLKKNLISSTNQMKKNLFYQKNVTGNWKRAVYFYCDDVFYLLCQNRSLFGNFTTLGLVPPFGSSVEFVSIFNELNKSYLLELHSNNLNGSKKITLSDSDFYVMKQQKVQRYNLPSISLAFDRVLKEYRIDFPNVNLQLIKKQFLLEIDQYTDILFTYDPEGFEKFLKERKSTHGAYLLLLFQYLNSILNKPEVFDSTFNFLRDWFLGQKFVKKSLVFTVLSYFFWWNTDTLSVQVSPSSLLYVLVNILYILYKNSGSTKLSLLQKLACFVLDRVPDSVLDHATRDLISIQDNIRLGHCLFFMFISSVLPKICHLVEIIEQDDSLEDMDINSTSSFVDSEFSKSVSESKLEDEEDDFSFFKDQGLDVKTSNSKVVRIFFKDKAFQSLQSKLQKKKKYKIDHLHLSLPMLVPPKKWKTLSNLAFIKDNIQYYNSNKNYSGGLLLNGILISRPLCKSAGLFVKHSLGISALVINYINKMQEQPLCLDNDLLDFYLNNKSLLPKFLSDTLFREKRARLKCVRKRLSSLYQERSLLLRNNCDKSSDKLVLLNKMLSSVISEKQQLSAELEDYRVLIRLLSCAKLLKGIPVFFFSYEVDFRMRLYCHPFDISFMGSKLMRSLIRFKAFFTFNLDSFKLYSSLQYTASRDLSELNILELFNTRISIILERCLILSELQSILLEAREPYLFLACAFEWLRYCSFVESNKSNFTSIYMSNFPIYLDCSANGPQLISLLFAFEDFAKLLNLCPQEKSDIRGDFYIELIANFLKSKKQSNWDYLKQVDEVTERKVLFGALRKSLKVGIMTQFYGVRYRTFLKRLTEGFYVNKELLSTLFNFSDDNFDVFVAAFSKDFWSFLQNLSLFKLKLFLSYFQKLSKSSDNFTCWSVFHSSFIKVSYVSSEKIRYGSRVGKDRAWFVLHQAKKGSISSKQQTALMANFVHSLDAYVLYKVCSASDFPILPIHDSFGVHSCNVNALTNCVRFIFSSFVDNQTAGRFFINQLADIIKESTDDESIKEQFLNFVQKEIKFGSLSAQDVKLSYYCIYYA